jgi:hypothetical protein
MTLSALMMMIATWSFVSFFTIKFFLKILKSPHLSEHNE